MANLHEAKDQQRQYHFPDLGKFQQLTHAMDRTRTLEDKRRAAADLVHFATRENYDCLTILRTLDYAYTAISPMGRDHEGGLLVLEGINGYLADSGISYKILFPPLKDPKPQVAETIKIHTKVKKMRDVVHKTSWFQEHIRGKAIYFDTNNFIDCLEDLISKRTMDSEQYSPAVVPVASAVFIHADSDREAVLHEMEIYSHIFSVAIERPKKRSEERQVRYKLLEALCALDRQQTKFYPNPYTNKFGQGEDAVSLKDIIDFSLGKDPSRRFLNRQGVDRLGRMMLRFLANMPAGDYLWQQVAMSLLLDPSMGVEYAQLTQDSDRRFAEKMYLTQRWIGERLYAPVFAAKFPEKVKKAKFRNLTVRDPSFDYLFAKALNNLDHTNASLMALPTFFAAADGVHAAERIFNLAANRAIEYCAIPFLSYDPNDRIIIITRETRKLFTRFWSDIMTDLGGRIVHQTQRSKFNKFVTGLKTAIGEEYDGKIANDFVDFLQANLGGNIREKLATRENQLEKIIRRIAQEMKTVDYWPHSGVVHNVEYTQGSFPEIMGLTEINFLVGETMNDPVAFHIKLQDENFGISGQITSKGDVEWKMDIVHKSPQVKLLLDYVVLATFKDLLVKGESVAREGVRQRRRGTVRIPSVSAALSSETGASRIQLPHRGAVVVNLGETNAQDSRRTTSNDLKRHVTEYRARTSNYSPHHFDIGKMKMPGVADYQRAYLIWKKAPAAQKSMRWVELVEVRKALHQPNSEKVRNLPEKMKLTPMLDPETNEQLTDIKRETEGEKLWGNTWRAQFDKPKLTDDEKKDLDVRYEKRYRGGSTLAFADVLMSWLVGEEGE